MNRLNNYHLFAVITKVSLFHCIIKGICNKQGNALTPNDKVIMISK